MKTPEKELLTDLLADLQHDLGKYLNLPLGLLPADASDEDVRAAVTQALRQTRRSGNEVRSARELWETFVVQLPKGTALLPPFERLTEAVARAMAWEDAPTIERAEIARDFAAVRDTINTALRWVTER